MSAAVCLPPQQPSFTSSIINYLNKYPLRIVQCGREQESGVSQVYCTQRHTTSGKVTCLETIEREVGTHGGPSAKLSPCHLAQRQLGLLHVAVL